LYSPLTFTVGQERSLQFPVSQYVGNMLTSVTAGIRYAARQVVAVSRAGKGVRLTLSTTDPTGRRLLVSVASGPHGTFRVSASPSDPTGVSAMSDSFASGAEEAFHGFGGRHNSLDEHGHDFYNWIEQENTGAGALQPVPNAQPGSGGSAYLFPNGPTAAYHVQNLFVSSRSYGFLLDRPELSRWRMDSDRRDAWQVEVAAPAIDYLVAPGSPPRALRTLTGVTGRERVPPGWAIGPMYDRAYSASGNNVALGRDDLAHLIRDRLPVTGYRLEGWEGSDPQQVRALFGALRARRIMPLGYFNPYIDQSKTQYMTRTPGGAPYLYVTGNLPAFGGELDVTSLAAANYFASRIDRALDLGAEGFMLDFGEATLVDMQFADGESGTTMHNRYPIFYDRMVRRITDSYQAVHPGRHIFFYTRSGFSGDPGNVAYDSAEFPGDESTDFSRSGGLASLTTDMLNRALGGAYGYTTDIGGYLDFVTPATTKELLLRWAEWAALGPLFRLHGSAIAGTHTPWSYDKQTVDIYRALSRLHLRARPLILRLWRRADRSGMPVTRPLWLQFPGDPVAARQDQEWLLGPDVLVAPVVEKGAFSRSVYFPRGCWFDPQAGLSYAGPSSRSVAAPLAKLPFFFRCGTDPLGRGSGRSCPRAGGRIHGRSLGPISLGERRGRLRRRYARFSTRRRRDMDFYCLAPHGIRVGFHGRRAVLALTANRHYAIRGIRPGLRLAVAARRVRLLGPFHVGLNFWYLVPGHNATGVLKVRRGRIQEIGIADKRLTTGRRRAMRFLESFR
jgi:alpha-glucosidase (family GH31 glycosyl hydrolase)